MTYVLLSFSEEIRTTLAQELAFKTEAMECECVLTIYWQNEIYRGDVEITPAGWHVQALPTGSADSSFVANGVTFWTARTNLEEISGKTIISKNDPLMLG